MQDESNRPMGVKREDYGELPGDWHGSQTWEYDPEQPEWDWMLDFHNDEIVSRATSETGSFWALEITVGRPDDEWVMESNQDVTVSVWERELDNDQFHTGGEHCWDGVCERFETAAEAMDYVTNFMEENQ